MDEEAVERERLLVHHVLHGRVVDPAVLVVVRGGGGRGVGAAVGPVLAQRRFLINAEGKKKKDEESIIPLRKPSRKEGISAAPFLKALSSFS